MHAGVLLALLAALAGSQLPAAVAGVPQATSPAQQAPQAPRLALLFSADVGPACAGRCRLTAAAARCDGGGGAASGGGTPSNSTAPAIAPASTAAADLEAGWNSVVLAAAAAPALDARVAVDCSDPACVPTPARFLAWRGAACTASDGLAALAVQPLAGAGNSSSSVGGHQAYSLGRALAVAYVPPPPPQALAAELAPAAPSDASSTAAPTQPGAAAGEEAAAGEQRCKDGARTRRALQLALAVWMLGCAALGARL